LTSTTSTTLKATSKKKLRQNPKPTPATPPSKLRRAGRITGVFGLRGEVKIDPTAAGRTVFQLGAQLQCSDGERERRLTIGALRQHQGRPLVQFDGVADAASAGKLVGCELFAPREAFVLESGEYLDEDLIGCRLLDEQDRDLGLVSAVEHYPAQDILVVGKHRVPLVRAFVRGIDLAARQISVSLPAGLLD
jgi:16S rRNA processing protein RimM